MANSRGGGISREICTEHIPSKGIEVLAGGVDSARILKSRKNATKMFIPEIKHTR